MSSELERSREEGTRTVYRKSRERKLRRKEAVDAAVQ